MRFSAGFWPPRFLDLDEISPRFLNLGGQNSAEISRNLGGQNPAANLAEIPKFSAAKILPSNLMRRLSRKDAIVLANPIKCFVSHCPPSREGGSVGLAKKKKKKMNEHMIARLVCKI